MILDAEQTRILNGEQGEALAVALKTLVRYGEMLGSKRLVPIKSAHLVGSFGFVFFQAIYAMIDRFVAEGLKVRVPTTVNPHPGRCASFINRLLFGKQSRLEKGFEALGVTPSWTCVFYESQTPPARGDVLAWAESSAVVFANSVLGARTNINALGIDLCSAVTGFTPEYGLLLDENRLAQVEIRLEIERMDASALGHCLGERTGNRIPVLPSYPFSRTELRALGAGLAASSRVGLFHVVGLTPEAPTLESVLPDPNHDVLTIAQSDLDQYVTFSGWKPDLVVFGCPQLTLAEATQLARSFEGRTVNRSVEICLNPKDLKDFEKTPVCAALRKSGVRLVSHCPLAAYSLRVRTREILTPSMKLVQYLHGVTYATQEACLEACSGRPAVPGPREVSTC